MVSEQDNEESVKCKTCGTPCRGEGKKLELCAYHIVRWKYNNDPEYKTLCKARAAATMQKARLANPDKFKQRSKDYRKNNPHTFAKSAARCWMRKLSKEECMTLIKEVHG